MKDPEQSLLDGQQVEPFFGNTGAGTSTSGGSEWLDWSTTCSPRSIQHSNVCGGAEADSTVRKQSIKCMAMVRIKLRRDLKK